MSIRKYMIDNPIRYTCNYSLRHITRWVEREQQEIGFDFDPPYQRGYVWTREQQIAYIEFLFRGGRSARDIYLNHPTWPDGGDTEHKLEVVDGKQRLTAVLAFMRGEFPVFPEQYWGPDITVKDGGNDIGLIINVATLKTQREVVEWYLAMNRGGTVHTEKDLAPAYELLKTLP